MFRTLTSSSTFGQISEIVGRFERKGYKLVAIKLIVPTKEFAAQHYDDLSARPFFDGLCDFLSSGPVVAMVCDSCFCLSKILLSMNANTNQIHKNVKVASSYSLH